MAKTKKPNKSGYAFRGLFSNSKDESKWVDRLKAIASKEMRSVSAQAQFLLMQGIVQYEEKNK